jgi:hypothetical protein
MSFAGQASAQPAPKTQPSRWRVGGGALFAPRNQALHFDEIDGSYHNYASERAFGVTAMVDFHINSGLAIGLAPSHMMHLMPQGSTASYEQLDVPLRLTGSTSAPWGLRPFAEFSLGYSLVFIADSAAHMHYAPGVSSAFGVGVSYRVRAGVAIAVTLAQRLATTHKIELAGGTANVSSGLHVYGLGVILTP